MTNGCERVTLQSNDVFHLHGFGYDGGTGYSVPRIGRESRGLGKAQITSGAALFGNQSRPDGGVEYPNGSNPNPKGSVRRAWDSGGACRRGEREADLDRPPGANVPYRYALPRRLDFGMDPEIVQTHTLPAIPGKAFGSLVSAVDADGNEIAGIRMPEVTVPLATHTGWNLRHPDNGGQRQLFVFMGSTIPFAKSRAAREAAGDPRLSIEERYASRDDYLSRLRAAGKAVADEGYVLTEDIDDLVTHAGERWDYYTNGHGG